MIIFSDSRDPIWNSGDPNRVPKTCSHQQLEQPNKWTWITFCTTWAQNAICEELFPPLGLLCIEKTTRISCQCGSHKKNFWNGTVLYAFCFEIFCFESTSNDTLERGACGEEQSLKHTSKTSTALFLPVTIKPHNGLGRKKGVPVLKFSKTSSGTFWLFYRLSKLEVLNSEIKVTINASPSPKFPVCAESYPPFATHKTLQ